MSIFASIAKPREEEKELIFNSSFTSNNQLSNKLFLLFKRDINDLYRVSNNYARFIHVNTEKNKLKQIINTKAFI